MKNSLRDRFSLVRHRSLVSIGGIRIYVDHSFANGIKRALFDGTYEQEEVNLIDSIIEPSDTVMEIGTGIGLTACFCAKVVGSKKVFTYEGNPALRRHIRRNFALNRVSPHLHICVVGERKGRSTLFVSNDFWLSSCVPIEGATPTAVKMVPLDMAIQRVRPTLLIIDAEGKEVDLVDSSSLPGVRKLLIEIHRKVIGDEAADQVISRLHQLAFMIQGQIGQALLLLRDPMWRTGVRSPDRSKEPQFS